MKRLRISKGGQVSIPAEVLHRWGTNTVVAEDEGIVWSCGPCPTTRPTTRSPQRVARSRAAA